MYIRRRDVCLQTPVGVQLFLLMFYPPKGHLLADSSRGPIVFTYISPEGTSACRLQQLFFTYELFGLVRVYWTFNLQTVFFLFEPPECLSPGGTLQSRARRWSIVFTYVLFWVRKRILDFQFTGGLLPF